MGLFKYQFGTIKYAIKHLGSDGCVLSFSAYYFDITYDDDRVFLFLFADFAGGGVDPHGGVAGGGFDPRMRSRVRFVLDGSVVDFSSTVHYFAFAAGVGNEIFYFIYAYRYDYRR